MNILYHDKEIIVVDKPGGLLSVPGRTIDKQDCVVKRITQLFPDIIAQPAVHRLDMQTSGIMVLARTTSAHRHLSSQFMKRIPEKVYIALLDGEIQGKTGRIELSFRLDPDNRPYQVYDPFQGKRGITLWRIQGIEGKQTRVEFIPLTGRTHQLRLHAAHEKGLNTPIVGDSLYGSGQEGDRMLLHSAKLSFNHPQSDKKISFASPVPF